MRLIDADAIPWTDLNSNNPNSDLKVLVTFAEKVNRMPTIEQPHWTPCSERLPDENVEVLCCFVDGNKSKMIVSKRIDFNYWHGVGRTGDSVYWMPLPEPYKESKEC